MSKSQNIPCSITIKILLKFYQGHSVAPRVGGSYNSILDKLIYQSVNRYRDDTHTYMVARATHRDISSRAIEYSRKGSPVSLLLCI